MGINSWYRSEAYNRSVGGGENSLHLTGGVADITKRGWTPLRIALEHDYLASGSREKSATERTAMSKTGIK